jgi:hypothetical protein
MGVATRHSGLRNRFRCWKRIFRKSDVGTVRKENSIVGKYTDITGQKFGRLTVLRRAESIQSGSKKRTACWCQCECEKQTQLVVIVRSLLSGGTKSCGCIRSEATAAKRRTHGKTRTRAYAAYHSAKRRGTNPNNMNFPYYGGRGVQFRYTSF